jgi:hypothetical protein
MTHKRKQTVTKDSAGEKRPTRFDAYEIHGLKRLPGCHGQEEEPAGFVINDCEQVADADAEFWGLFGHIPGRGLDCIGDFATREHAEEVYARITGRHHDPAALTNRSESTLPSTDAHRQSPLLVPDGTPLLPGRMYLRLMHGRTDPARDMDERGFDGPTFGPLAAYVHIYCSTFRIHGEHDRGELWLERHDDMIRFGDAYYGDLEVFIAGPSPTANRKGIRP